MRMGLLDDAIRDHLELKRRSGADPGEVAREQHEALDPVERAPDALVADDALADAVVDVASTEHADRATEQPELGVMAGGVAEDMPDDLADDPAPGADGGDETAELDMRTVFDENDAMRGVAGGIRPADGGEEPPVEGRAGDDESLEWEMPGDDGHSAVDEEGEPDPDVLEETPDFLRETPEHERLWFEQQPPRDFDFDN
ncbi:MAG TPA: hypothetical protein VGH93_12450 [Solirubrobacteraceae bacterium]